MQGIATGVSQRPFMFAAIPCIFIAKSIFSVFLIILNPCIINIYILFANLSLFWQIFIKTEVCDFMSKSESARPNILS
ncbi:hypothetical protein Tresu_2177 [Treponema succinifaciens DSM 2489]|uniref:Uncharacterized protein n=1 Tax=Treponema succinifaciens (strain ATCC 33096 / DSM 2489 / 6091) TaxID=869209 RepID=F2NWC5_TRES6|nr:hypothetical protein Tresu_2177 [Treponema succinifaciens DSM 2489]